MSPTQLHGASLGDRIYRFTTTAFALSIPLLLVLIGVEVLVAAWPALTAFKLSFLTSSRWDAVEGVFGAAPAIYGTLVSSALALAIATPLAVGVAIFLSEFAPPWLRTPVAFLIDLLAAIPSVVYGLWGIFVLVPALREYVMPFLAAVSFSFSFDAFPSAAPLAPSLRSSTLRPSAWSSFTSTLKDSGTPGREGASPLMIASYILVRPWTSSDLTVRSSWSMYAAP